VERARPDGSARPHKSVRVVFEAEVVGGELTAEVGGTTDEARWFPLAQVPDLRRAPIVDVAVTAWLETRPAGR
jgi:8-oxo-dGTP diphosphatase